MRLSDLQVLNEHLGNLAQLNAGPLINVLRQPIYSRGRRHGDNPEAGPAGRKFVGYNIGSTSPIVDLGTIKHGMKDIRKAYRTNEGAEGFVVHIGGTPVMFGLYDLHALEGSSRPGKMAYDFTPFADVIKQMDDESREKNKWNHRDMLQKSYREKEPYSFEKEEGILKNHKFFGEAYTSGHASNLVDKAMQISKIVGQPVTAKLVLVDSGSIKKKHARANFTAREIEAGKNDLMTRLKKFKLGKKPTVDNIDAFVKYALENPGKTVKFAGRTYTLKLDSYDKIEPVSLLNGKTFEVRYSSADPNTYDSLVMVYKYDPVLMTLKPILAKWQDYTDPNKRHNSQEAVLDGPSYLAANLGIRDLSRKTDVLPKILALIKADKWNEATMALSALKKSGLDWPEIAVLEKTIEDSKG